LPRRPVREEPRLDEDLANFVPPPGLPGPRRLFIEGVPARLRLVVVAPLGKAFRCRFLDEWDNEEARQGTGKMKCDLHFGLPE
jgi:hypothetical protein